jgi:rhodanese-related sulfurtransferase
MSRPFRELRPVRAHADIERYRVIDVREEHEFHGPLGFIDGAELVPLPTLAACADKLAGSRPLLFVCRSGKRSGVACETLQKLGFDDVTNLAEGMIGWNSAGLPVLHTEPKTLARLRDQIVSWAIQVGLFPAEAANDIVRERCQRHGSSYDEPSHGAVEDLISFVADSLGAIDPPDLELSLAAFRRALAVL